MLRLYNQDCIKFLKSSKEHYDAIFLDPPDNIELEYQGFTDNIPNYVQFIRDLLFWSCRRGEVVWLSFNVKHWNLVSKVSQGLINNVFRIFIWRYNFGQYNRYDCGNGFRPILRLSKNQWEPNVSGILVESERMRLGDPRSHGPRVPDDVWDFPRVTGNHRERRTWHPTQHPEALVERMFLMSIREQEAMIPRFLDCFAGSGTSLRVVKKRNWNLDSVEISSYYCEKLAAEHSLSILGRNDENN